MRKLLRWQIAFILVFLVFISCEKKTTTDIKTEPEIAADRKPSPPPGPSNDNCANATALTPEVTLCNQTTAGATVQSGEVVCGSCLYFCSSGQSTYLKETVWYSFTATASDMYIDIEVKSGGPLVCSTAVWMFSAIVYNTTTCVPGSNSIVECRRHGSRELILVTMTGLTAGKTYLVQVGYFADGRNHHPDCKSSPVFCIKAGNTEPACANCNTPCGATCELATSPPSNQYVKDNCTGDELIPRLFGDGNYFPNGQRTNRTLCYTFTAAASTVDWGIVWEGGVGTILSSYPTIVSWEIQQLNCTGVIQSGSTSVQANINPITGQFTGLTANTQYTVCFKITPGGGGTWYSKIWPYVVGVAP